MAVIAKDPEFLSKLKDSTVKAEKVVKAPKYPVMNKTVKSLLTNETTKRPAKNPPILFTISVGNGREMFIQYLLMAPIKPPIPTKANSFIFCLSLCIAVVTESILATDDVFNNDFYFFSSSSIPRGMWAVGWSM